MDKVTYIPLGGAGKVTKNMHVFETEQDILIIDCGIGFPESDQLGVDVLIPDISYLRGKKNKIRGIVISHAHEDHIGGLPYVIEDLGRPPIYATQLPLSFIRNKLEERNLLNGQSLHLINPDDGPFKLGGFEIDPYRVNHSVPDALGLFLRTPAGNIVFAPDFKFDWTPVDGVLFDIGKIARLSADGVQVLFSDSLGSLRTGYTESEQKIQEAFEREMEDADGQVFITTMSSNISRMQQAINASVKYGRRVVPVGRSVDQNLEIATRLGYIKAPKGTVLPLEKSRRVPGKKLTYIVAGSFGQRGSALDRIAKGEHRRLQIHEKAVVIFSADPIPGVYDVVGDLIDDLTEAGARVVYSEIQDDLHVSGHGSQGDLSTLMGIVRPKFFVPIGGSYRHQRGYLKLAEKMGFDPKTVFELRQNNTIDITTDDAKWGAKVATKDIFVDGNLVGDVGPRVLDDRLQLAEGGMLVLILQKGVEGNLADWVGVVTRGMVYVANADSIIDDVRVLVQKQIRGKKVSDWANVRSNVEQRVQSFVKEKIGREPLIVATLAN